jgi:hypothetical protein
MEEIDFFSNHDHDDHDNHDGIDENVVNLDLT